MPNTLESSARKAATSKAWFGVVRAYNLCDAAMASQLAVLGLRVGEHEVLANLMLNPGMTQQALAKRCFVAKSGISMLLTRMEAQALLRREADPSDSGRNREANDGTPVRRRACQHDRTLGARRCAAGWYFRALRHLRTDRRFNHMGPDIASCNRAQSA